jgi:hypothetical protein
MLLHCTICNYENGNVGYCQLATCTAKTALLSFCVFVTVASFLLKNLQNSDFDVTRKSRNYQQEMMLFKTNESVTLLDSIVSGIWAWLANCNCRYIQGGLSALWTYRKCEVISKTAAKMDMSLPSSSCLRSSVTFQRGGPGRPTRDQVLLSRREALADRPVTKCYFPEGRLLPTDLWPRDLGSSGRDVHLLQYTL